MIPAALAMTMANRTTYFGPIQASFRQERQCTKRSIQRMVIVLILRSALTRVSLVSNSGKTITPNA